MTWVSHSTIATAIVLPFNPAMIPIAVAGSTAPDWLEYILKPFMPYLKHRKETHYLAIWLLLFALSFWIDWNNFLFYFALGGVSHILTDSLTVSGVPISPYNHTKFHLFGGALQESSFYKFRTGSLSEYIIAFSLLAFSFMISKPANDLFQNNSHESSSFNPFYVNYGKMYDEKIIDEKEYKESRFKFF